MADHSEKVSAVIETMHEGHSLSAALEMHKVKRSQFYDTIAAKPELANRYARARLARADMMADQVLEIADSDNDPAKVRNQILARQWHTAKAAPQVYGERLDLNLNQTVDLTAAILEAKKRALQSRFNDEAEDAEVIETPKLSHDGATADSSVSPAGSGESADENSENKDPPGVGVGSSG
jgi:hypothetical protein